MMELNKLDKFFDMPIRIYNELEIKKIQEDEDAQHAAGEEIFPTEPAWVKGYVRIPYDIAARMSWADYFSRHRELKEVADKGFDATQVFLTDGTEYTCPWQKDRFEKEWLKWLNRAEAFLDQEEEIEYQKQLLREYGEIKD